MYLNVCFLLFSQSYIRLSTFPWKLVGCLEYLNKVCLSHCSKKPSLDSNDFKNYRPISNLRFLSKTTEKCVAKQLIQYLDINDLGETSIGL